MSEHAPEPAPHAHPPATLEGWYFVHEQFVWAARHLDGAEARDEMLARFAAEVSYQGGGDGWTLVVELVGSPADIMVVSARPDFDTCLVIAEDITDVAARFGLTRLASFLSVTEAGLYHITAELAKEAVARGGAAGDEKFEKALTERAASERDTELVQRRLYPQVPDGMPYVCFYPMSKRRGESDNWYGLSLEERSRLMYAHGTTGRRYAGRVQQVITGAIGFNRWEWGVTLFARDPLDFKRLLTDMRFDEVSARYAEFGDFYVGKIVVAE